MYYTPVVMVQTPDGEIEAFETIEMALEEIGDFRNDGWRWYWAASKNHLDCAHGITLKEIKAKCQPVPTPESFGRKVLRALADYPRWMLWDPKVRHAVLTYSYDGYTPNAGMDKYKDKWVVTFNYLYW